MRCPIRGHAHDLVHVQDHVQSGTGAKATTWECPSGLHRFLLIEGLHATAATAPRYKRPRWGWKRTPKAGSTS